MVYFKLIINIQIQLHIITFLLKYYFSLFPTAKKIELFHHKK